VKKYLATLCAALSTVCAVTVNAQNPPAREDPGNATPLKVQVVVSRYQGEKKTSSMPYTLAFNVLGNGKGFGQGVGSLRMGSKIPIRMMTMPVIDGQKIPAGGPVSYQDVGTNIDCRTIGVGDGRFSVEVTVDDTSVYADENGKQADQPSFRSFRATNSMILKDGQSGQFTSAVDKVNGEVTKVDVTLTVVKQ
jgi:hypothetical protein